MKFSICRSSSASGRTADQGARSQGVVRLAALAAVFTGLAARADIELEVDPMVAAAGQSVLVYGAADCETYTVNVGDGTAPQSFDGPGPFMLTHVYAEPGVYQVLLLGTACDDGIDSQVSTIVVNAVTGGPVEPGPPVVPPGPATSLSIDRVSVFFANDRPVIRVRQNEKSVQAFAQIRYAGTGLLQGYWEVDGAAWAFVNEHLVFGDVTTIASPALPGLPTTEPGLHRVRLVLTRPSAGYAPPLALYFAAYDEAPAAVRIQLMRPVSDARLGFRGHAFEWAVGTDGIDHYGVRFFDVERREVVFSALVRGAGYELSERVVAERFSPGRPYEWQVVALDGDGRELGLSRRRRFALEMPADRSADRLASASVGVDVTNTGNADSTPTTVSLSVVVSNPRTLGADGSQNLQLPLGVVSQ